MHLLTRASRRPRPPPAEPWTRRSHGRTRRTAGSGGSTSASPEGSGCWRSRRPWRACGRRCSISGASSRRHDSCCTRGHLRALRGQRCGPPWRWRPRPWPRPRLSPKLQQVPRHTCSRRPRRRRRPKWTRLPFWTPLLRQSFHRPRRTLPGRSHRLQRAPRRRPGTLRPTRLDGPSRRRRPTVSLHGPLARAGRRGLSGRPRPGLQARGLRTKPGAQAHGGASSAGKCPTRRRVAAQTRLAR